MKNIYEVFDEFEEAKNKKERMGVIPICIYLTNKYIENVDRAVGKYNYFSIY
jgi:hypothetical protein